MDENEILSYIKMNSSKVIVVDELPQAEVLYDMDTTTPQYNAVERVGISIVEEDNNSFLRFLSAENTQNKYAYGTINTSSLTNEARSVIVEFDFRFNAERAFISISDITKRPGSSYRATIDNTGVIIDIGSKGDGKMYVNGSKIGDVILQEWLHMRASIHGKTVSYEIKQGNETIKSDTILIRDTSVSHMTGLDFYSWNKNISSDIDNIDITAIYAKTDGTIYAVGESGDCHLYTYKNGELFDLGCDMSTLYDFKGSKTVAQINALTGQSTGWVYNVADSGTLTFGNVSVTAGDNVAYTADGWDKLSATVDLSNYVTKDTIASITQLGMIKLKAGAGGDNASGIAVDANGVAEIRVWSARGVGKDGVGRIYIVPATDEEVAAGTEQYKPITPKTLKTVTDRDSTAGMEFTYGDFDYIVNQDTETVTLSSIHAEQLSGSITVPSVVYNGIFGYTVTELGDAFKNKGSKTSGITSITLPDTITKFTGTATFYGCSSMRSIHLPKSLTGDATGNGFLTKTFHYCSSLFNVEIPEGISKFYGTFNSDSTAVNSVSLKCKTQADFYAGSGTTDARAWKDEKTDIRIFYPNGATAPTRITGSFTATAEAYTSLVIPATQADVIAGTEGFKPITPKTLKTVTDKKLNKPTVAKGYSVTAIDTVHKTYTLDNTGGIEVNMRYSVRLASAAYDAGKITAVSGNTVTVDVMPNIALDSDTSSVTNYLMIVGRPDLGTIEVGTDAYAFGENAIAQDRAAFAEGRDTKALGQYSHAEGRGTTAGYAAHAEGRNTKAMHDYSHAEGYNTEATGQFGHAEGRDTKAVGQCSHSGGIGTEAQGYCQTAIGKYNVKDTTSLLIVGNGTADNARSNALTLDRDGNLKVKATIVEYTDVPVQIGTWVDGTPIWRVAFETGVASADYPLVWVDEEIGFADLTGIRFVNNDDVKLILNESVFVVPGDTDLCITDNIKCPYDGTTYWSAPISSMSPTPQELIFGGFIEFVTPADNIQAG